MLKNIKAKEKAKSKHAISNKMTDLQKIIRYLNIKSLYLLTKSKTRKENTKENRKEKRQIIKQVASNKNGLIGK